MKSKITKAWDYRQCQLPEELLQWRITDQELAQQLEVLSHNHAFEADVDCVQTGDSVACRGESAEPRWNRPLLLFYPGRGICDSALENACVGAKLGETRTIRFGEAEIRLTVTRIVRRSHMPINDELIRAEGIDGVSTLAEYAAWYRAANEPTRRKNAAYRSAYYLTEQVAEHSEFSIDEAEKSHWIWGWVSRMYDALVEAGMDPTIPKEGFDFLTEEEAKQQMYDQQEPAFQFYVANVYLAELLTGQDEESLRREGLEKLARENAMTPDELLERSGFAMVYGRIMSDYALDELAKYTEQFLEA